MDGNNSEDGYASLADAAIDSDDLDSNEDTSANSSVAPLANNALGHTTMRKALEQMIEILSRTEEANAKALEDAETITKLKHKMEFQAASERAAKRMKIASDRTVNRLEDENLELRSELNQKADRDSIREEKEKLRRELDEKKAELQQELTEKADYHEIEERNTEFQRELENIKAEYADLELDQIEKANDCKDLKRRIAEIEHERIEMAESFQALASHFFPKSGKQSLQFQQPALKRPKRKPRTAVLANGDGSPEWESNNIFMELNLKTLTIRLAFVIMNGI